MAFLTPKLAFNFYEMDPWHQSEESKIKEEDGDESQDNTIVVLNESEELNEVIVPRNMFSEKEIINTSLSS